MSDEKIRVKDLAAELNVSTKEVMRVLRELDIPVRSSVSSVEVADLPRVRSRFKEKRESDAERREIQPGVIVRRRRPHAVPPQAEPAAAPVVVPDEADIPEPRDVAEISSSDEASQSIAESVSAQVETAQPQVEADERNAAKQPGESAKEEAAPARPKKRSAQRFSTPAAKVISRPGDEPTIVAPAPQEIEQVAEPTPEPCSEPEPTTQLPATSVAEESEAAPAPVSAAGTEPEADTEQEPPVSRDAAEASAKTQRRAQPAASAVPEGSSAPSLLPPVAESKTAEAEEPDDEKHGRKRRIQESTTPQVRIISRPDPSTAPRRSSEGGSREGNRTPGGRPSAPASRPGAGSPRPGAPRPGGRSGGYAPMPTPGAEGPDGREGQSKKKRNKGRRTVDFQQNDMLGRHRDDDDGDMPRSRGRRRAKGRDARPAAQVSTQPLKAAKRKIRVEEAIRVADMAHQMGLKSGEIIKVLFNLGVMATINKALDIDTASVVAAEFGYEVEKVGFAEEDYLLPVVEENPEALKLRPPVVTIMGHVDHGKTSLLDAVRKTNVTSGEAGGITQHIGAYHVRTKSGEIVFLDTPGHEAFTAMRARGAQVTDLVVLVVAADDGVMEQTREAVNHSRAAGVPIMVAVNKIDKPDSNPDRVLRELAEIGLVPEDWGGDTVVAKVSAKTREGLDEMLELLALQADILELKANPDKPARGHIVEAKLDKGRGPVATVLIQDGTLRQGDTFVCGVYSGRVRAMFNDQGRKVKEAGPSIPVEVQGFEGVPEAGEEFICLTDEKLARRIAESRAVKLRERELAKESRVTLETFLSRKADAQETLVLNLVVKADVQGSLEAILEALNKQSTDKVRIQIIHGGTGAITESDILLASASDAIVIGFNVRPTAKVKEVAEHENVDIRFYDIIYKLVDEIKGAMAGLLAPVSREQYLGQADVREVFSVPKFGSVAGSHVSDGKILRNAGVRLLRDGVVVYTGKIASLRRFKDDVREVVKGYECGIGLENFNDIKTGDVIEAFEMVEEAATL